MATTRIELPVLGMTCASCVAWIEKGPAGVSELRGLPANRTVNGCAVSPVDPKVMYVAMWNGLFKSAGAGEM